MKDASWRSNGRENADCGQLLAIRGVDDPASTVIMATLSEDGSQLQFGVSPVKTLERTN